MSEPETIQLGPDWGVVVAEAATNAAGHVQFQRAGATLQADVYKALYPNAPLAYARVCLVAKLEGGQPGDAHVLMVDDEYWGRRIQPAEFTEGSFAEQFVMGYRLTGTILLDGEPIADANVSLEGVLVDAEGHSGIFWDSLEYNELIYSSQLETYVEGAQVYAPIRTDEQGRFVFVAPKGHGAVYQREGDLRDDTQQTAEQPLPRYLQQLQAVYLGRKAMLVEGEEAAINLYSGTLSVSGTPGAMLRIGTLDDHGQVYLVPQDGPVTVTGLPAGEHSIVQFKRNAWGEWDPAWGCPRVIAEIVPGQTTYVTMPAMEQYDPGGALYAGRVYLRMGVPAAGIAIVAIDWVNCEIVGTVAATDGDGYWEAEIPEQGFGGDLWIHDATWGTIPVIGFPYSDVVLGARAYSSYVQQWRPEAWRKKDRGHKNFQYVQDCVSVQDRQTSALYGTVEAAYGGWQTEAPLPNFRYIPDLEEVLLTGPQQCSYRLLQGEQVLLEEFTLAAQSFEDYPTLSGRYRAAGIYPQFTYLLGGKIAGNVLSQPPSLAPDQHIAATYPEALRVGLEFGTHSFYTEMRLPGQSGAGAAMTAIADFICPYCGAPAHRDPDDSAYSRGFCTQCADTFGFAIAMDCRTYFLSPTLPPDSACTISARIIRPNGRDERTDVAFHWRPDLYDETEDFVTQDGLAQPTNAPRWVAKHVNEVDDGKGFGIYNSADNPPFTPGHDVAYFSALPEIDRDLGLTQLKLCFPYGYVLEENVALEIDCVPADDEIETVPVQLASGLRGPDELDPLGDVVLIKPTPKLPAEKMPWPYAGAGLYKAVAGLRVTSSPPPQDCRFGIVNDNPWLARAGAVPVEAALDTPVALQLVRLVRGGLELLDDAVGQIYLFYTGDGDIWLTRRRGLTQPWEPRCRVTSDASSGEPAADKDDSGMLLLFRQMDSGSGDLTSHDDGRNWH